MSIISRMRKQTAVYWPLDIESGGDKFDDYGQPVLSDPIEIKCRWEDVSEEFIGSDGTRQISNAKVYVDRDVDVGGVLMLGTLLDVSSADNPKGNIGAFEIRKFEKIPNLKATEFLRTAYL